MNFLYALNPLVVTKYQYLLKWTILFLVALTQVVSVSAATSKASQKKKDPVKIGHYLAGRYAQSIHDSEAAIKYYRSSLFNNPNNINLINRTFSVLVFSGRIKESLPLAEKLYNLKDANSFLPAVVLSLKDIRAGNFDQAVKKLSSISESGITEFSMPLIGAWSFASKKEFSRAIGVLQNKMNNPGMIALFAPHAGLIAELAQKPELAEKFYKDAMIQYRQIGANLSRLLGNFYERTGQNRKAEQVYKNYIQASPRSSIFDQALKRIQQPNSRKLPKLSIIAGVAETFYALSESIKRQNPYHGIVFVRLALFVDPNFVFAKLKLADELTRADRLNEALNLYQNVSKDPSYRWIASLRIARTHNFLDQVDKATAVLRNLAKKNKDRIDALVDLGTIYRNRKRYRDAVNAFELAKKRIKKWEGRHWRLLYKNAASLERLKQWPAAEKEFLSALKLSPNEPDVLNYLGYSWVEQGKNLIKARKMIELAAKQRPQAAHIVDSLGWVQYRIGNLMGALKNLERAVLLTPSDPTINDHLGDVYWELGRTLEARYLWKRALALEPEKDAVSLINKKIEKGLPNSKIRAKSLK